VFCTLQAAVIPCFLLCVLWAHSLSALAPVNCSTIFVQQTSEVLNNCAPKRVSSVPAHIKDLVVRLMTRLVRPAIGNCQRLCSLALLRYVHMARGPLHHANLCMSISPMGLGSQEHELCALPLFMFLCCAALIASYCYLEAETFFPGRLARRVGA